MPAERAGYTVTMFLIDLSPSMGNKRMVETPNTKGGEPIRVEMTNLEWSLQFVKLKIQEMIFNGRKTDQCGVIVFGTPETNNILNERGDGYEHVYEYIPIGQPNATTLTKVDALRATSVCGDPIDAVIVGIEVQGMYLTSKKTWTRKMVLVTDGRSPIELDEWERTPNAINERNVIFTIIGVDFDDDELPYKEDNKPPIKGINEDFYHTFISKLDKGTLGTCALALQDIARPDVRVTKSVLMGTVLRIGDVDARPEEAMEIMIKTSKCTALARPKGWKRFTKREGDEDIDKMEEDGVTPEQETTYVELKMRSEYFLERSEEDDNIQGSMNEEDNQREMQKIEKEELIKGFKYGSTYVPCPEGQFERLKTRKGIDICGFFKAKNLRRELMMGEIQYVWADPGSPNQQVALSSIVQAMTSTKTLAIARWVTKDGMDPKMGVLTPCSFDKVDCLLWAQMPFADDVRKYAFASLDTLINQKGEILTKHPYIPTEEQREAMDNFVDAMDLMEAGEDENGERAPWYDNRWSYNPAVHRIKQAMFHSAVVADLATNPLPPPHPEIVKYFDPPRRVLKRARREIEECKQSFKVKQVPKKVARARKDEHVHAREEGEDMLLLDKMPHEKGEGQVRNQDSQRALASPPKTPKATRASDSDTETEDEELMLDQPVSKKSAHPLPTPSRSPSPEMLEIDPEKAPGRIVGSAFPLEDFKKNLAEGDVVSKVVGDLAFVIRDIVKKPFASRRYREMLGCMRELRDVCLKEDEIESWNDFMMVLRDECIEEQSGNRDFWAEVKKEGRTISLISQPEAANKGGRSMISESVAGEFIQK